MPTVRHFPVRYSLASGLNLYKLLFFVFFTLRGFVSSAQDSGAIRWMTFEAMETAFAKEPKMVFIDFWASWCGACKRMDKYVFSNPEVVAKLNADFYCVKMNAQTTDTISFGGKEFVNNTAHKKRAGFHELAVLLGKNNKGKFSLPLMLLYDSRFRLARRIERYMPSKAFLSVVRESENQESGN